MSLDAYNKAIRPKVHGSWNLHEATLKQPLDFFVMLASAAGMVGHPGQGNYTAGNAYEDALAHYRVSRGLPATTIDLGIVHFAGYVAENPEVERSLSRLGFLRIEEDEFFAILEIAVSRGGHSHQSCQMFTGVGTQEPLGLDSSRTADVPFWLRDPIFSHLLKMQAHDSSNADTKAAATTAHQSLHQRLKGCVSITEAVSIILDALLLKLAKSLMMNGPEDFDPSQPVSAYGVDSLVAVELRNWIVRETKADVPVFEILQSSSLNALALQVAERRGVSLIKGEKRRLTRTFDGKRRGSRTIDPFPLMEGFCWIHQHLVFACTRAEKSDFESI